MKNIFEEEKSLIVAHYFFLENASQLGVFWLRRGLKLTTELSKKVQNLCNQAIKNSLNEAILLMSINEALLSRQIFVPFK